MYKGKTTKSQSHKQYLQEQETRENKQLADTQHSKRTKPPTMIIEGKSDIFRLQPPKCKTLNPIDYLRYRALFIIKQSVISFFPNFSNRCKPDDLCNRTTLVVNTATDTKLSKMSRHLGRYNRRNTEPPIYEMPDRTKNITV